MKKNIKLQKVDRNGRGSVDVALACNVRLAREIKATYVGAREQRPAPPKAAPGPAPAKPPAPAPPPVVTPRGQPAQQPQAQQPQAQQAQQAAGSASGSVVSAAGSVNDAAFGQGYEQAWGNRAWGRNWSWGGWTPASGHGYYGGWAWGHDDDSWWGWGIWGSYGSWNSPAWNSWNHWGSWW